MQLESYLRAAAGRLVRSDTPHLDARLIAGAALGLSGAGIILAADRQLTEEEENRLGALLARRRAGESVAHIVGEKEFYGLTFRLAPGVLAPRADTETLVDAARRRLPQDARLRILDLGVGSGAILLSLMTAFPHATGVGVDIGFGAVACARDNARRIGLLARAAILCGDWADSLTGAFDLIVANPPYVPFGEASGLAREVRWFEDPRAVFGGEDGLGAYRRILPQIRTVASPDALTILEFGLAQSEPLLAMAAAALPGHVLVVERDLSGRPRALVIEPHAKKHLK